MRFFEDFLDFVDILGHRAFAQRGIIMLLPKCGLAFDVTSLWKRIRFPIITQSTNRCAVHQIGGEVLIH